MCVVRVEDVVCATSEAVAAVHRALPEGEDVLGVERLRLEVICAKSWAGVVCIDESAVIREDLDAERFVPTGERNTYPGAGLAWGLR